MQTPETEKDDTFGEGLILPPLIIQLRKILDQYPDDSQIFKELLQNAEDAGAKNVKFLYDRRSYSTNPRFLYHPALAKYQGPALYAYNDAVFDESDWKGIRMLSQSVKQNDPLKVGYFGLGFKSVFHLTDMPFILSGDHIGVLDPHQQCFPSSSHGWNLTKEDSLLETYPYQFEPFCGMLDCTKDALKAGSYSGTMFRFPLRTQKSALSDVLYTDEKMQGLLETFQEDAHLILLFLRFVETIEIYQKEAHSPTPKLLFKVQISDECLDEVRQQRSQFLNAVNTDSVLDQPVVCTYPITIESTQYGSRTESTKSFTWLVTNYYMGGKMSAAFRKLQMDPDLCYPPWVGTAMPLSLSESKEENTNSRLDGHVFCVLPLPSDQNTQTGLPIHVNGYFALEQNRKYVKWPTTVSYRTREDLMDKRLLWNQCMLREALPKAYAQMLLAAVERHRQGSVSELSLDIIYRAFPNLTQVDRKWDNMLPAMYAELFQHPVIYTKAHQGQWIHAKDAIFDSLDLGEQVREVILDILTQDEIQVAMVPEHVQEAIRICCMIKIGKIIPNIISASYKRIQHSISISYKSKMELLRYFLKQNRYDLLDGLELLPLSNGGFHVFFHLARKADRPIYITASPELRALFPSMDDDFVDEETDRDILEMLIKAAERGYTQLVNVDRRMLGELLNRAVPSEWLNSEVALWKPGEYGHPLRPWLESLWNYLVANSPRDLSLVQSLPCIPVGMITDSTSEIQLVPLASNRVLMMRQMDGICLGEGLEDILSEMGIYVIENLPDYVKIHPLVSKDYIFSPSYIGVIKALEKLSALNGQDYVLQCLSTLEAEDRRKLRKLFAKVSEYELTQEHRAILSQLPLFETVEGSGGKESHFVAFCEVNLAAPADQLPVHVSRCLLELNDTHSVNLAQVLGVKNLGVGQLLVEVIFPDIEGMMYENDHVERLMTYVLKQYHYFLTQDKNFHTVLTSLPFMPRNDMLLTADRFYDPDNELLQNMFYGEDKFPSGTYSEPSIVAVLGEIGLRGVNNVDPEDLLESAYCVPDFVNSESHNHSAVVAKSDAILTYICKHLEILQGDCQGTPLWQCLQEVSWVRRLSDKPNFYPKTLPWFEGNAFYQPKEMVCRKFAHLVGSAVPVVALEVTTEVQQTFQWDNPPSLQHVVQHLSRAVQAFEGKEKAAFVETMDSIYSILSNYDVQEVRDCLEHNRVTRWVWHGEGFASPQNVFFQDAFMDLAPYVYCIPWELRHHRSLFTDLGVSDHCDLPDVLRMIKDRNETDDSNNESTVKRDLHIAVSILNELKSHITEDMLLELQERLFLPVHQADNNVLQMAPLLQCTYSDVEWIRQGYDLQDLEEGTDNRFFLVHPNVPVSTSEALGVPTLMSRMLDAEELDFSFGQTDSLTHRLNVLLGEYTDGFSVPKELVQNADDAGATEVKFLYDERRNEDVMTCLIDEGMRECQGPALWAYNNAVFTDADLENITKLSGATKENQTDKIGRFGLGFNAVYNLTDVPSFVSRHNIVIFDPHTTHLGKNIKNKAKPGIKIDLRKHRRKLYRLGNQFKPYNDVFGCDLRPEGRQESYSGTLFRFPLRTRNQALRSEICQKHYDDAEVKSLLHMLISGAENLLLFTQNVVKISLYHLSTRSSSAKEMGELFSVEKRPLMILRELRPAVELPETAKELKPAVQQLVQTCSTLHASTMCMKHLRHGIRIGNMEWPDSSVVFELAVCITTEGEVILEQTGIQNTQPWLVTTYMGQGEELKMALQEENLLPTAGVAVPLKKLNDGMYEPIQVMNGAGEPDGTVFTYLPLPVHSGLPVHINAPFAVTASRRHLCEKTEDDKFDMRALWNQALMTGPVCLAYIKMLIDLQNLTIGTEYHCCDLWPSTKHVQSACRPVLTTFYNLVANDDNPQLPMQVFSDGRKWGTIHDAHFLDTDYVNSPAGSIALKTFRECTSESSDLVVDLPFWTLDGFDEAEVLHLIQEQTFSAVRFFEEVFLPNMIEVDPDDRDSLVLDALLHGEENILAVLKDEPCIPVTPSGKDTKKPSDLVDPNSVLACLYTIEDGRFPFNTATFASPKCLSVLFELGMARDSLTWQDVLERAESVEYVDYSEAKRRIPALLNYINTKVALEGDDCPEAEDCRSQMLNMPLLPVLSRPAWFPVPWTSDDQASDVFVKPSAIYPPEYANLVCCVGLIADPSCFPTDSDPVKSFLDMKQPDLSLELVLSQLDLVTCQQAEEALCDKVVQAELVNVCNSIYTFLEQQCHQKRAMREISRHLKGKKFILWKTRFLSPDMVALDFPYNCSPYLQGLPEHLKNNFSILMNAAGVKEKFETVDYVQALQNIHNEYADQVLGKDLLKLAIQVVNLLNDSMEETGLTLTQVVEDCGTIYIPDANNVLQSASNLCFNEPECQWLPAAQNSSYSHPLIPFTISKQLGVNTKRQEVLKKHSRGIPFGQRERLTNRLKRILSTYPCDKEILKEMLQNADDSGATEIHFVKDPRQHGTDRVFEESWRPLQGPALCVYNNKPFSEADIQGIQRLGEGSKGSDPNKTGQYGVGFNCVYHLTDAPSFLTKGNEVGETLCIFDPHGKYVPGASIEEPGRRYDDVSALRGIFTDIFPCYLEEKFPIEGATMFRLPLRTAEMAEQSELSDQTVDVDLIDTLFSKFKMECFDCMLFLNNVTTLGLTEIDSFTKRLTNSYKVTVQMDNGSKDREEFAEYIKKVTEKLKKGLKNVWNIPVKSVTYSLDISDNYGQSEKWLVSQQIGFSGQKKPSQALVDAVRRDLALLPRGGVAALISSSNLQNQSQKKAFCFLPLPVKTDLPVHINGHFALESEARRNIWMDIDSGPKAEWNQLLMQDVIAPSYVNLLQNLPQYLSTSHIDSNMSIMEMSGETVPNMEIYCDMFPNFNKGNDPWTKLTVAVYEYIHHTQASVLPVARPQTSFFSMSRSNLALNSLDELKDRAEIEWLSTSGSGGCKPYFDNLDYYVGDEEDLAFTGIATRKRLVTSTPKKKPSKTTLRQVLLASGFRLIKLPISVFESFIAAGIEVECVSPSTVVDFYKSYDTENQVCTIGTLPCDIYDTPFQDEATFQTLLEYCAQESYYFQSNLESLPFLLTQDNQLRQFSRANPVFLTPYHDLLPGLESLFIHHNLARTVFKELDVEMCEVFQRFDIKSFASLLSNVLPKEEYMTGNKHVVWPQDGSGIPSPQWVWMLWSFVKEEYAREQVENPDDADAMAFLQSLLAPLKDWCLVPAIVRKKKKSSKQSTPYAYSEPESSDQFLVPVGIANTVIDYSQTSIMSYPARDTLRKLNIPELNCRMIDGGQLSPVGKGAASIATNSALAKLLAASLERPKSVLYALQMAIKELAKKNLQMRPEDCYIVCKYFSEASGSWASDFETHVILKRIPLFLTLQGNLTKIGKNEVFAVPNELPKVDIETWEKQQQVLFIVQQNGLEELYEALHCKTLTTTETYTNYIFKHFEYLSPGAQVEHLKFIKDTKLPHLQDFEKQQLLEGLRDLEFLRDADGFLRKACEFYDPYHPVFKEMLQQGCNSFPPAPFCEFKWLDFMRKIGLQHDVTGEMFIHFANEVAYEAKSEPTQETFNKARILVTHLFKVKNLPTEELLDKLVDIQFIPAAKVNATLHKIYPAYGDRKAAGQAYISFKEGIPENDEVLVWTSSYLLPDWANPFKLTEADVQYANTEDYKVPSLHDYQVQIAKILKIQEHPQIDLVVSHIQNICKLAITRSTQMDDLQAFMKVDVMKRVYRHFLDRIEEEPSDETLAQLETIGEIPCIVTDLGKTFVKPTQVVINLYEEDQIMPYLYKAPTELGEFKKLFLQLGATPQATANQYVMVLHSIYHETLGDKLHPNELRLAFRAVHGLFKVLQKKKDEVISIQLYLPSTQGRLVASTDLVFNDDPTFSERIRHFDRPFLVHLAECNVKADNYRDLIQLIPRVLRPSMLTHLVQEELEPKSRDRLVIHGLAEKLRYQINSKAFSHGIMRLLRHEHRKSGHKVKPSVLQTLQNALKRVQVFGSDRIITYLTYDNERIPGSEFESQCFAEKRFEEETGQELWTICVNSSIGLTEELLVSVAEVINRIIGEILSHSVHYIQPILTCAPHSISRVLDKMRVRPDHSVDTHQTTLPPPGSFIPIEDHHLLKEDFEDFEPGEYVGYELDDDETGGRIIIYAVIVEKFKQMGETEEDDSALGKIFTQQYRISVGEDREPTVACVTDLYKFHRVEGLVNRGNEGERTNSMGTSASTPHYRESFYAGSNIFEPQSPKARRTSEKEQAQRSTMAHGNHQQQQENDEYADFASYQDRFFKGASKENDAEEAIGAENGFANHELPEGIAGELLYPEGYQGQEGEAPSEQPGEQANGEQAEEISRQEQLMEEISDALEDAWKLPEGQKKKVIKRLLLKWHPDKNIGEEEFATIITQHIHSELERLELGLPRPEKFEDITSKFAFDPRNPFSGSDNFKKNFYNAYQFFFEQMNQRAKEHKEQRERYKENFSREYSHQQRDYNFDVPPSFSSSNPQPAQAKRFMKQAQEDLRSADNDYEAKEPAFEWVCFKAHQAAEKAFKAAQFSVDAVTSFSHDLVTLAASVEDMELRRLAQRLQGIVGNSSKLYNPDPIDFVVIPHEEYNREMACDAVMCSTDILERVKEFLETRE